ncbi:hypothetical protein JHK87_018598 [Glycine soja]|nr:hypothetical protein JHK87_018598 [Glycine soja]
MNLSYCRMVTKFPYVSSAMNLRELALNGCENLLYAYPIAFTTNSVIVVAISSTAGQLMA